MRRHAASTTGDPAWCDQAAAAACSAPAATGSPRPSQPRPTQRPRRSRSRRSCAMTAPSTSRFAWACTPVRRSTATGNLRQRGRPQQGTVDVERAPRALLVSDATEVLLRDRVGLRPLGEHRLRGYTAGCRCTRILAETPGRLPRAAQRQRRHRRSPAAAGPVIGREEVVGQVAELVPRAQPGHADRRRRGRQDPPHGRGRSSGRPRRRLADGLT